MIRYTQRSAGFTLVEVLVALSILSITFTVLLQVIGSVLDRTAKNERQMIAVSLTQSLIAEAGTAISTKSPDTSGKFSKDYHWILHVEPYGDSQDQAAWPARAVIISASTFWDGDRKSVTLTALITEPKELP